ncbi:MAG TPA: 6-phosphogluconolactonase [Candidatus Limnocylindria bacterium]|nr:6-phosphogluconolactonase [Candidatus Limnocylindria bacterium]
MTREFVVLPNADVTAAAAADRLLTVGQEAIDRHGAFHFALTGGYTPRAVCPLLVVPPRVNQLDWTKVEFFFGDERAVPSRHPESNYNTARLALLDYLPRVQPGQVHRMLGEATDLDAAARAYEAIIRRTLDDDTEPPRFDLIWLGMGADGHTASLFPGTEALAETERLAVANWVPSMDAWRLTLTFPILNAAREVNFVVVGSDKAAAVASVRSGSEVPSARIDAERTTWFLDHAAAGEPE